MAGSRNYENRMFVLESKHAGNSQSNGDVYAPVFFNRPSDLTKSSNVLNERETKLNFAGFPKITFYEKNSTLADYYEKFKSSDANEIGYACRVFSWNFDGKIPQNEKEVFDAIFSFFPSCKRSFLLARCYHEGFGVPQDKDLAVKYYTESIPSNPCDDHSYLTDSNCGLGMLELNRDAADRDITKAILYFENYHSETKSFTGKGSYLLGVAYEIQGDLDKAFKFYGEAASNSYHPQHKDAVYRIGMLYATGAFPECPQNLNLAIKEFKLAAQLGHPCAKAALTECSVLKDQQESKKRHEIMLSASSGLSIEP